MGKIAEAAMRVFLICLFLFLVPCSSAWAQKEQPPEKPPDEAPQNRPTLGPQPAPGDRTQPAPSLNGPRSSTTNDPQKLLRLKKIYVERIDNLLSERLMEGLAKIGRFRIVADIKEADGVLRGTCFDSHRLKSLHSEVFISDRATGASIWRRVYSMRRA